MLALRLVEGGVAEEGAGDISAVGAVRPDGGLEDIAPLIWDVSDKDLSGEVGRAVGIVSAAHFLAVPEPIAIGVREIRITGEIGGVVPLHLVAVPQPVAVAIRHGRIAAGVGGADKSAGAGFDGIGEAVSVGVHLGGIGRRATPGAGQFSVVAQGVPIVGISARPMFFQIGQGIAIRVEGRIARTLGSSPCAFS